MSYRLVAKRGTDIFEHIPLPELVISHEFKYEEGTANLLEDLETWTVTGYIVAPEGSIKAQTLELSAFFEGGELDYVRFLDGEEIIDQLADDNGVRIVSLDFPEGAGPEWATKRKYVIKFEGVNTSAEAEAAGEVNYTITYSTDQSGIITRTINGTVADKTGASYSKFATLKSDNSWSTWAGANLITDEYTTNDDDTECRFNIVHKKYWVAFPAGITNSSVDSNSTTDDQNVTRGRISGWFEGSVANCNNAIATLYPLNSVVLEYSVTRSTYTNRTSFSISYVSLYGNNVLEFSEVLSIDASVYDFVYKRVLGGAPPIRQVTSRTTGKATQRGSMTQLRVMPTVPPPHWNAMYVKSARTTQHSAQYNTALGSFAYTLDWVYEYEFSLTPSF
jgi:hypothetical protein